MIERDGPLLEEMVFRDPPKIHGSLDVVETEAAEILTAEGATAWDPVRV